MKTCTKCFLEQDLSMFCKDKQKVDGVHPHCRSCRSSHSKEFRQKNREHVLERSRKSRQKNIESIRKRDLERCKNPERRAYKNARNRYYLVKHRSLNKMFMKETNEIYKKAIEISNSSGIKHEVDHIIPIKGANVSGLHVPWNLTITTQFINRSKGNLY